MFEQVLSTFPQGRPESACGQRWKTGGGESYPQGRVFFHKFSTGGCGWKTARFI